MTPELRRLPLAFDRITGETYEALLTCALKFANRLVLVTYRDRPLQAVRLLMDLTPWLQDESTAAQWPGSKLMPPRTAVLLSYRYDGDVQSVLLRHTQRLEDWGYPVLPDDPHLQRQDESVWFGSTVHEERAWLQLSDDEALELGQTCPLLQDTRLSQS